MTEKTCTKCQIAKPVEEFYFRDGKPVAQCKECAKEIQRARRRGNLERVKAQELAYSERNREKRAAASRAYYADNRDAVLDYKKKFQVDHREKISAAKRARFWANREEVLAANRAWREANPEVFRESVRAGNARRRARLAAVEVDPGLSRGALRERDGDLCTYCGVDLDFSPNPPGEHRPTTAHLDHVVPISRGGPHTFDNAVLACAACNLSKNDRTPEEWAERKAREMMPA